MAVGTLLLIAASKLMTKEMEIALNALLKKLGRKNTERE